MTFLSPWFLLGGLAAGIPIWLHLVRREQPIRIPFSSLMFFRRMPVKSVSRQKLKYLFLLATRILIVLLIALAFARPYIPFAARVFSSKSGDKHMVVLLDNSLSMRYRDRWQRALNAAQDAVGSLRDRDRAQIVTFSSEYEIKNLPTSDKATLRAILEKGVSPSDAPTSYPNAFRAIEKIGEDVQKPISVVMISDVQKSGMPQGMQTLPSGPVAEFKLVDVAGQAAPNWTVQGARSHRVIYKGKYPDRLVAEVRGYGTPEASREVTLTLGNKMIERKTVQVPASGAATVTFETFDVPPGSNKGEIRIAPSDDLAQDDAFHFVLERREPYRILFLHEGGETREMYYFRSALAAEPDSPLTIDAKTPIEAGPSGLQDYRMVILSNVAAPPPAIVSGLRDFVKKGGGVLITMGSRFPAPELEAQWKDLWPGKGLEKKLMTPDGERMVLLGQIDKDHPLFHDFQETGAAESLRSAKIFAYVRYQADGAAPLRFSNGDPALLEKKYGQGRVLLFASSFDNVWSDFPLHPSFIPLVHQLIRYSAQLTDEPPAYAIPSAVSLNNGAAAAGIQSLSRVWDVVGPDGKREVPLAQETRPDFLTLRQAGFYEVRQGPESHLIAANTDPKESDLTPLSAEDRALWVANASAKQDTADAASGPEADKRQTIWWNLLLIALLLGLVEAYLANQYLGRKSTGASSDQAKENAYAG